MALTSVILIVDRYFEDQEIIVDNLKNANSSVELLILNNFGYVIPELKDLSTQYIESNSIIEMNFAECVNVLLPYCSGEYIVVFYDYGYLFSDWLKNLIASYNKIENSGVLSIISDCQGEEFNLPNSNKELSFFLNQDENMDCKYFDNNVVSGIIFFSNSLLKQLGAFNTSLNEKYLFWEYCHRAGLIGKYNYYNTDDYCIKISNYTSAYASSLKDYQREIKNIEIFKILNPEIDHSVLINKLKENGLEADYTKKMNCVVAIKQEFNQHELAIVHKLCNECQYEFQIICTGYFDDYIWKGRVAILLNKIL